MISSIVVARGKLAASRPSPGPLLALALAATIAACATEPPTAASDSAQRTSLQISPGWPDELFIGCGISINPRDLGCGFTSTFETPVYVDSLIYNDWYISGVLTHFYPYYDHNGTIDLATPLPVAPIVLSFSPAVKGLIVRAAPQQNACYRHACIDSEGLAPHGSWDLVVHEVDGTETTLTVNWDCTSYNCKSSRKLGSDIGIARIEIIPTGTTIRDHIGFEFTAGLRNPWDAVTDSLVLSCPDSVVRGQSVRCSVAASSGDTTPEVLEWHFQPADTSLGLDIARLEVVAQDTVWEGIMATSGTVRVVAKLADSVTEATQFVTVTPRPGWDTVKVAFPRPAVTDNADMSDHPYRDPGSESLGQLGHIHEDAATFVIGSNFQPIGTGPNTGMAFLTSIPYVPRWVIHVNFDQLKPNSNLGRLQPERAPDYESKPTCTRSQLPGFVKLIEKHEGADLDERSHAGRYSKTFNEQAGRTTERIVLTAQDFEQKRELDRVIAAFKPVIAHAKAVSAKADTVFKVPFGCELNLFPAPTPE